MRLMRVRKNATARERRRLAEVNRAYTELSRQVPQQLLGNATKLEVLRGATQYIQMLMLILDKDVNCDQGKKRPTIYNEQKEHSSVIQTNYKNCDNIEGNLLLAESTIIRKLPMTMPTSSYSSE